MGVDVHGFNFLRFAEKKQMLGSVATIGRQGVHIQNHRLSALLGAKNEYGPYCEDLLVERFGASTVESFDNSTYENATFVHDFNKPIDPPKTYDTVVDFGTLEHVFNVSQALANVSKLCKPGGQILHALPANNFCGHGFWQFSPELFFSLYTPENGYADTSIFVADAEDERNWYEVRKPAPGLRAEIISHTPLTILVRTKKLAAVDHGVVQQSDYAHAWEADRPNEASGNAVKEVMKKSPQLFKLAFALRSLARRIFPLQSYKNVRLAASHTGLIKRSVAAQIGAGSDVATT